MAHPQENKPRTPAIMPTEYFERPAAAPAPAAPKVYLATPCYGCLLTLEYTLSVVGLQAACLARRLNCVVDFVGNESLVQRARNILVARFLQSDATHMLFVDADIGFKPEAALRLLDFLVSTGEEVACAVYPKKHVDWRAVEAKASSGDPEPLHQAGLDFNINVRAGSEAREGFVEVLDCATGFMMISRGALERMCVRFAGDLTCVNDIPGQQSVREYVALFDCMIDPVSRRYLSEDYAFCRRWQSMGGKIWADLTTPLCHTGSYFFEGDLGARLRDRAARPPAVVAS